MELKKVDKKPDFVHQVWQHLLRKWYKKTGRIPEVPWMAQKESDILTESLRRSEPVRCLEWGSGFSTLHFPRLLSQESSWLSIEHDKAWFDAMRTKKLPLNVELLHIPPDKVSGDKDGTYEDFRTYIDYPEGPFDFILIDGRARNDCLLKAAQLLHPEGLVILHDANRSYYHQNLHLFPHQYLFKDHRKGFGGLWMGSPARPIDQFISLNMHQSLWRNHLRLLRLIRPFHRFG